MPVFSDPTGTRLVVIPNALWADLAEVMQQSDHPYAAAVHADLIEARNAAPADPAEALRQALAGWISGDPKVDLTDFSDDLDEVVTGVLAALGCVVERSSEKT